jgi:hypothetical protein
MPRASWVDWRNEEKEEKEEERRRKLKMAQAVFVVNHLEETSFMKLCHTVRTTIRFAQSSFFGIKVNLCRLTWPRHSYQDKPAV